MNKPKSGEEQIRVASIKQVSVLTSSKLVWRDMKHSNHSSSGYCYTGLPRSHRKSKQSCVCWRCQQVSVLTPSKLVWRDTKHSNYSPSGHHNTHSIVMNSSNQNRAMNQCQNPTSQLPTSTNWASISTHPDVVAVQQQVHPDE